MRRSTMMAAILACFLLSAVKGEAKSIRFIGTAGFVPVNEVVEESVCTFGGGVHLSYPVSDRSGKMNTELSISNWYNCFPCSDIDIHVLRFGFGIRVFYNGCDVVRPYFTHDILTHIVWVENRGGYAPTYGILLGLGLDVPLGEKGSSIFFDMSYNSFDLVFFETPEMPIKHISFSFGYSWSVSD